MSSMRQRSYSCGGGDSTTKSKQTMDKSPISIRSLVVPSDLGRRSLLAFEVRSPTPPAGNPNLGVAPNPAAGCSSPTKVTRGDEENQDTSNVNSATTKSPYKFTHGLRSYILSSRLSKHVRRGKLGSSNSIGTDGSNNSNSSSGASSVGSDGGGIKLLDRSKGLSSPRPARPQGNPYDEVVDDDNNTSNDQFKQRTMFVNPSSPGRSSSCSGSTDDNSSVQTMLSPESDLDSKTVRYRQRMQRHQEPSPRIRSVLRFRDAECPSPATNASSAHSTSTNSLPLPTSTSFTPPAVVGIPMTTTTTSSNPNPNPNPSTAAEGGFRPVPPPRTSSSYTLPLKPQPPSRPHFRRVISMESMPVNALSESSNSGGRLQQHHQLQQQSRLVAHPLPRSKGLFRRSQSDLGKIRTPGSSFISSGSEQQQQEAVPEFLSDAEDDIVDLLCTDLEEGEEQDQSFEGDLSPIRDKLQRRRPAFDFQ